MKLFRLPLHFSLLVFVDSFHVQSTNGNVRTMLSMSTDAQVEQGVSRRTFAQVFGGMTMASIFVNGPKEAMAFQSSSITLSDEIKTLDFSLPSYDAISSSKASVNTVEGLAEQFVQEKEAVVPSRRKPKEPKASSGGNPMGSLLPSMNKGATKAPKPKPAPAPKAAPKEKEEKATRIETMDLSLPSYDAGVTKEKSIFSI